MPCKSSKTRKSLKQRITNKGYWTVSRWMEASHLQNQYNHRANQSGSNLESRIDLIGLSVMERHFNKVQNMYNLREPLKAYLRNEMDILIHLKTANLWKKALNSRTNVLIDPYKKGGSPWESPPKTDLNKFWSKVLKRLPVEPPLNHICSLFFQGTPSDKQKSLSKGPSRAEDILQTRDRNQEQTIVSFNRLLVRINS